MCYRMLNTPYLRRMKQQIVTNYCNVQFKGWEDFEQKVRGSYWTALKMNWKVWTPFQFININFVPVEVSNSSRALIDG